MRHGTVAAFATHYRRGDEPCDKCRVAKRTHDRKLAKQKREGQPKHGSYAGAQAHYRANEKPCDLCRGAHNEYARMYRLYGPIASQYWTSSRVYDYLMAEGSRSLQSIQLGLDGNPETIRRTLYRMVDREEIMCDPYTRLYSVGGG